MPLPLHPEGCDCQDCPYADEIIDDIVATLVELGGSTLGPGMRVPEDDDLYYDIFLSPEELDKKYP